MVVQNGTRSNGIHHTPTYPSCPSDYEAVTPADTAPRPEPRWCTQFPTYTHNVSWVDTDSKQHSLTIRGDDLDELLATLTAVKRTIRASRAKAESQDTPATPQQPDVMRCHIHNAPMPRRWSRRTSGHYFSHALPDGSFCYGRPK
jgi:hypothetical protein